MKFATKIKYLIFTVHNCSSNETIIHQKNKRHNCFFFRCVLLSSMDRNRKGKTQAVVDLIHEYCTQNTKRPLVIDIHVYNPKAGKHVYNQLKPYAKDGVIIQIIDHSKKQKQIRDLEVKILNEDLEKNKNRIRIQN